MQNRLWLNTLAIEIAANTRYMPRTNRFYILDIVMESVLLVVHLLIAVSLIGVVLLQRSEGGALGIGGGGGGAGGSMFSSRGAANLLTRSTAGLAAAFFVTSITLTILARGTTDQGSIFDTIQQQGTEGSEGTPGVKLPQLPGTLTPTEPQVPVTD